MRHLEDEPAHAVLPGPLRAAFGPKCRRLASLIATYGQAIEYDLITSPARLDLATEWRGRRWRRLLNVIDRLPRHSAYFEALADDEALAERVAAYVSDDPSTPKRRMRDWSPTVEILTAVLNRLGELVQAVAALGGASPRQLPPAPHPVTAIDRVKARNRKRKHAALVARVLPHRAPP